MADTYTTNLNLTKPEPGAAEDTWGISLNSDLDTLDAIFSSSGTQVNLNPNQVNFADGKKSIFGTGSDLEIYHDGSNSYIKDVGTGNLIIEGSSQLKLTGPAGDYFMGQNNGSAYLYHAGSLKAYTTSTGINVTGTVVSDGLTVDGDATIGADSSVYDLTLSSSAPILRLSDTSASATHFINSNNSELRIMGDSVVSLSTNNLRRLRVESNGDIAFMDDTGTTQSLFWDASTERLGIGTTSPSNQLHIQSSGTASAIRLEREDTSDEMLVLLGSSYGYVQNTTGALGLGGTNSSTDIYINASGNVGIGTDNPSQKLTVEGNIELGTGGYIYGDTTTTRLRLSNSAGSQLSYGTGILSVAPSLTYTGGGSERFRVTDQGNVGIGTSNPTTTLHVADTSANITIQDNNSSGNTAAAKILFADSGTFGTIGKIGFDGNDDLIIENSHTGNILLSGGNVGIGTTSPSSSIDVFSSDANIAKFTRDLTTDVSLNVSADNDGTILSTGGVHNFRVFTNNSEAARFDSSGHLLIGTTSTSPSLSNVAGIALRNEGHIYASRDGGVVSYFNRKSTDGTILDFRKDGTAVGSIDTTNDDLLIYSTATGHKGLRFAGGEILPVSNAGALEDNTTDLGSTAYRFKNLQLSGQANVGTINNVGIKANETDFTGSILISDDGATGTLSSATSNTGLGSLVLANLTSGDSNVAVGRQALNSLTTGSNNTAVGRNALFSNTTASNNVAIGYYALSDNTTGQFNTAIGREALTNNTTASNNVAVGYATLHDNTTGGSNVALGYNALTNNETGSFNIGIGREALVYNTTAGNNIAVGYQALLDNTTGASNIAVGNYALSNNTTNSSNIAIGHQTLQNNTTGFGNTAVGTNALRFNTTSSANAAFGYQALFNNTSQSNTAVGYTALFANTSGSDNTAVGRNALVSNTTGAYNTAVGKHALDANTTGTGNTAVGTMALDSNTTASDNTAVGYHALFTNTTGGQNIAIGRQALYENTTAAQNTAVGYQALKANTTGQRNIAMGNYALQQNTTANDLVAIGYHALIKNTTGGGNVAVGKDALRLNTTASNNTAVGYQALENNTGSDNTALGRDALEANTTGGFNVAIGKDAATANTTSSGVTAVGADALKFATGSDNTAIGKSAGDSITTGSNNTCIGYQADTASATSTNSITLGDANITTLRCNTQTISALSDARDKSNVEDLQLGVEFIKDLRPVSFTWDRRDGSQNGVEDFGFIAQELDAVQEKHNEAERLGLVLKDNPDKLEASYGKLVPMLVKAIQELSEEVEELKQKLGE